MPGGCLGVLGSFLWLLGLGLRLGWLHCLSSLGSILSSPPLSTARRGRRPRQTPAMELYANHRTCSVARDAFDGEVDAEKGDDGEGNRKGR